MSFYEDSEIEDLFNQIKQLKKEREVLRDALTRVVIRSLPREPNLREACEKALAWKPDR